MGYFVTLEGGEGAGKTTQAFLLVEALRERGHDVAATREPGGSAGGERIRALLLAREELGWDPVSEALLHFAARRENVERSIRPALERGAWVVSDRFVDSTLAYQGYGAGAPLEAVRAVAGAALGDFRPPDLTLILDLDPARGLSRVRASSLELDRYESRDMDFHRRVRAGFREIAAGDPARCAVIDAGQDEAAVSAAVLAALDGRLGRAGR